MKKKIVSKKDIVAVALATGSVIQITAFDCPIRRIDNSATVGAGFSSSVTELPEDYTTYAQYSGTVSKDCFCGNFAFDCSSNADDDSVGMVDHTYITRQAQWQKNSYMLAYSSVRYTDTERAVGAAQGLD